MTRKRVCSLFRRAGEDMEKKNAYFTVEAALVLPIVIAALLFVIYMMLFQYDRCLLEQDMGAIALWGSGGRFRCGGYGAEDAGEIGGII